jgi:alpha-beta hydrolase superfamily lysophospholipase
VIEEILLTHGARTRRATLFLHGYTASPLQFAQLAARVHASGENVYVPALPRHGCEDRMTDVLRDLGAGELLEHAVQSLERAAQLGETVRIVGFSLGGLLAAWLAQRHTVERAIAVAPLLGIAGFPVRSRAVLANALLRLPNAFVWWDPLLREKQMPAHGYPRFPTHGLARLLLVADDVFRYASAHRAASPITLLANAGETAVNNRAVERLARIWQAKGEKSAELHRIGGLGFCHDIIEPLRPNAKVEKSYPILHALLEDVER